MYFCLESCNLDFFQVEERWCPACYKFKNIKVKMHTYWLNYEEKMWMCDDPKVKNALKFQKYVNFSKISIFQCYFPIKDCVDVHRFIFKPPPGEVVLPKRTFEREQEVRELKIAKPEVWGGGVGWVPRIGYPTAS